jgi:adenosylcobyric acid synthase
VDHLSNYTDFSRLEQDARINLFYTRDVAEVLRADIIILPGSKNTLEDLLNLRNNGVAAAIQQAHANKKTIIGICGGYQMMGEWIEDPLQVESDLGKAKGLGLLPVSTVLRAEKTTRQSEFRFRGLAGTCRGYEIHMGETTGDSPLIHFTDGRTDGYFLNPGCWGTYLHGILDNAAVIESLLAPYTQLPGNTLDYRQYKEEQYDKLAALLRQHLAIEEIYKTLQS